MIWTVRAISLPGIRSKDRSATFHGFTRLRSWRILLRSVDELQMTDTDQNPTPAGRPKKPTGALFQEIARCRSMLFDSILKPYDMTMAQAWVIDHLYRQDGLQQNEIAERISIATVTASKLIDRLERRGFVVRQPDPDDRRAKRIYLTDQARDIVPFLRETIVRVDDVAFAGISQDQIDATVEALLQIKRNLAAAADNTND